MQQVIAAGITPESVGVMERLVALDREMKKDAAAVEFAGAFARLQASLKTFQPTKAVPDKHGNVRYTYLPDEEIMRAVTPLAEREGVAFAPGARFCSDGDDAGLRLAFSLYDEASLAEGARRLGRAVRAAASA